MEDILREPVELIDEDLDEVAGGFVIINRSLNGARVDGGGNGNALGGVEIGVQLQ